MPRRLLVTIGFAALAASAAGADDWPCWRGPDHNGVSKETEWLDRWPDGGPKVLWTAEVGTGFSAVSVASGRAFTIGNAENVDTVFAFDAATGKVLWKHGYPSDLGSEFFEGGPTSTPTADGDRVFVIGKWGDAFSFEAATGKVLWKKNLKDETGLPAPGWGFGGSPYVMGDLLLFNIGEAGLALEKATGKVVWKSAPHEPGYSTPVVAPRGESALLVLGSGKSFLAVDARTGKEAWRIRWVTQYGCNAADPVVQGDRVFISSGYGRGGALLKLDSGEPVWQNKAMRNQMNPSVLLGGYLYGVDGDTGQKRALKCVEFATGAEKWAHPGVGSGAVAAAGGKLIVLTDEGELQVGPASPEGWTPTARAKVLDGKCWTVPVLAHGRIYARSAEGRVVCLDVRKP
jgi:outer membrane protein assembly factor BamB